jgi:thiosulfate reductase/polysulfide reductase chain A
MTEHRKQTDDEGAIVGLSRRSFLKTAVGGSLGGAVALGSTIQEADAFSLLRKPEAPLAEAQIPSICELCFWKCGLIADVRGNRILELRGQTENPNAQGKLCGRGNAGAAFLTDKDRLRYPMRRVGRRGEGKFERIGWPTAYRIIANEFAKIKRQYGAQSLALFYHGSGGVFLRTMMLAYGCPNFAAPAYSQCKGSRDVGYKLTFGEVVPTPENLDFEHTQCMVLFGSHLGENAHNSQVQELVRAKARGAKLIVLDPRMSTVASKADMWLPIQVGTDVAIIMSWIHLLIAEKAYDHNFVANHTVGFDELSKHVTSMTPQWAAKESGISEQEIVEAYKLIKAARPSVVIHPGRHVTWYGEIDTQRARAQAIFTALLGAWWTKGGAYRQHRLSLPDFPGPDFPDLPAHVDKAAKRFPFALEPTTNGIRDATLTGKPYPIKGWFVFGTNLIQAVPDISETVAAIKKLDMIAVCDILPTEITKYADILLPEDIYLERYDDLHLGVGRRPFISLRQPVVQSPYDTRPAWRIAKELGTELGVGDFFAFSTFEQYLESRLKGSDISLDELKKKGTHFPAGDYPNYMDWSKSHKFRTPSGKVELYSRQLAEAGFEPLPVHKPLPEPPRGYFRMIYGRSALHSFGRTQNNPILFDLVPTNCLWMNPKCASALGFKHGAAVIIRNQRGDETGPLRVRVTERMPAKMVYLYHGFGHLSPGMSRACCVGGSDSHVIDQYVVDNISGATGMRVTYVSLHASTSDKGVKPCDTR